MNRLDNRWHLFPPLTLRDPERSAAVVRQVRQVTKAGVEDEELAALYEVARGLHHNRPDTQGYVVELGSYRSGSACALALGLRDASTRWKPVVTVDSYGWTSDPAPQCQPADIPASIIPVRGDEPGLESAWVLEHRNHEQNYVQARRAYWALGLASDHICPVIIRTQTFFQLWSRPLRVVFVDASHEYDRTFLEIQGSLAHLCEDGWLVFHDYYRVVHLHLAGSR